MTDNQKEKDSLQTNQNITRGNNPNDDEEILKNNSEPVSDQTEKNKQDELKNDTEKEQGSKTVGVPG